MMNMIVLLMLLASFATFSSDEECGLIHFDELKELENLKKVINWEATSTEQIKNALCSRRNPFSDEEMKAWMRENQSKYRINKAINGISFQNESPENLEAFYYLTTSLDFLKRPIKGQVRTFSSDCQSVDCAVQEIFGDTGTQLLYMQRRYGMNGSHIAHPNSAAWKKDELDTVLLAISDFPDGIFPIEKSRTLTHAPRGFDSDRTYANATITIYDLWNTQNPEMRRMTILHELGHAVAKVTKVDDSEPWMKIAGWEKTTKIVDGKPQVVMTASHPESIVSKYGKTNNWEDLAESVVAYRYNPNLLKELSPDKYNLIKETIFDNVEYTSEDSCLYPERLSTELSNIVSKKIESWQPTSDELLKMGNRCSEKAIQKLARDKKVDLESQEFQYCYEKATLAGLRDMIKVEAQNNPYAKYLDAALQNSEIKISPDVLEDLIQKVKNGHKTSLRNQLDVALKNPLFCQPDFFVYANQRFKDEELGTNTYSLKEDFTTIAKDACPNKANRKQLVPNMIK